jgi:hypothetical protein
LELFDHSGQAIDGALHLLLSSPLSPSAPGPRDADILQKFSKNSDYYGKDIFEAANMITPIHLAMFWAHKSTKELRYLERSQSVPVEGYGNLLKSAWLLRRLYEDRRLEKGFESYRSIIVILTEEVLYQIKYIVELKLSLPATKNLLNEADSRIWIDDLEDYEERNDNNYDDEDERRTIRTATNQGLILDTGSPRNHVLGPPTIPNKSDRRQSPTGLAEKRNGVFDPRNQTVDDTHYYPPRNSVGTTRHKSVDEPRRNFEVSPQRPVDHLEQLPARTYVDQSPKLNGNINRQTSNPSSTDSEPPRRNGPIWQSPPLHPPSLMPRYDHSKRKPLPEAPSPKADTHSNSPRRSYSVDSTTNTQTHIAQQLAPRRPPVPNSMPYGIPPLPNQVPNQNFGSLNTQFRRIEEDSDLQAYDPRFPPDTTHSAVSPSQDTISFFNRGLDPRDNDERPGEVEVMKDIFKSM